MKLSVHDLEVLSVLQGLSKEAREAEELIKTHFKNSFGIGNTTIKVYQTQTGNYNGEGYLTVDNAFWYYDNVNGGRKFGFLCTADGIYQMLRYCYLRNSGNTQYLESEQFSCEIKYMDDHFRKFISQIKSK